MIKVKKFAFNDFQENTFVLYDDTKECVIIDCGCYYDEEKQRLADFITENGLKPVKLLSTHGHVDHMLGNAFVSEKYKIPYEMHKEDKFLIDSAVSHGSVYGFQVEQSPEPENFIEDGDTIKFGDSELIAIHVPGHSPGSIVYYCEKQKFIIAGDVLFSGSIGRTDLPKGDYNTLISRIKSKLLVLPEEVLVYCGHGPETTIGEEKRTNYFLKD